MQPDSPYVQAVSLYLKPRIGSRHLSNIGGLFKAMVQQFPDIKNRATQRADHARFLPAEDRQAARRSPYYAATCAARSCRAARRVFERVVRKWAAED